MKLIRALAVVAVLIVVAGCNALGGVPDSTVNTLANAGGGCVKVTGVWGTGIVIVGSADKGVIRNGEVTVAGDCGGVTIRESARPVATRPTVVTPPVIVAPSPGGSITITPLPASPALPQ